MDWVTKRSLVELWKQGDVKPPIEEDEFNLNSDEATTAVILLKARQ